MDSLSQLKTIKNKLLKSPLFHLSLSSLELFHSNFWEWLFKIDKKQGYLIFTGNEYLGDQQDINTEREKSHIDFTIKTEKEIVFIENKIKDIPHKKQLDNYKKTEDGKNIGKSKKYILITLFKPATDIKEWKVITYEELAKRLSKFSPRGKRSEKNYQKAIIADYRNIIENLFTVFNKVLPYKEKYDFFWPPKRDVKNNSEFNKFDESMKVLKNDLRFEAVYLKQRSNLLAKYIFEKLEKLIETKGFNSPAGPEVFMEDDYQKDNGQYNILTVGSDYSPRGHHGVINVKYHLGKDTSVDIQIENNQYRHFLRTKNCKKKAEKLRKSNFWFTKDFKSRNGNSFCKYGNEHLYQYEKPPLNYGVGFKKLTEKIVKDLKRLFDRKNYLKKQIGI